METQTTEITEIQKKELAQTGSSLLNGVNSLVVKNEVGNNAILTIVGQAKKGKKVVNARFKKMDEKSKENRRACIEMINSFLNPLDEVIKIGLKKSNTWLEVEQEKREAQQRKLDEEFERKQEAERKRVEAKQRLLDEAFERKQEAERQRVAKLQAEAEAKGKVSTAVEKEIIQQVAVEREIPQVIVPKVAAPANSSYTDKWYAEVPDLKKLCEAIVNGIAPVNSIMANMPVLNSMARIAASTSSIPGVLYKRKNVTTQR